MLKRKQEVNYRKGTTGRHCAVCDHFVDWYEPSCSVIGLEAGRAYRVGEKNLCDRFDNRRRLEKIKGEEW